jgi:hypothetical protein
MVCPASVRCSLGIVLVPCHENLMDHSCPFLIQGGCKREWLRTKNKYKVQAEQQDFFLFLVNSWAEVRPQWFSTVYSYKTICRFFNIRCGFCKELQLTASTDILTSRSRNNHKCVSWMIYFSYTYIFYFCFRGQEMASLHTPWFLGWYMNYVDVSQVSRK